MNCPQGAKGGSTQLLLEVLLVLVAGCVIGLLANTLAGRRGLSLSRDYFPGSTSPPMPVSTNKLAAATNVGQTHLVPSATNDTVSRLQAKGLQVADSNLVNQLFRDPLQAQEVFIFVDARDDNGYKEGHVPGAYQFYHYRPADYIADVLPACLSADKIVIYCNGGNCEDSEFAAITLKDAGVPAAKLFVYPGGFSEWSTNGMPIETGTRKSGVLKEGHK
jgi:rhodanese-related sulfurtransferase